MNFAGATQEVARLLTGLGLSTPADAPQPQWPPHLLTRVVKQGSMWFDPLRHDFAPKEILGQTIAGLGWPEFEQLCHLLAGHPATARHISRQYLRCLIGVEPDGVALAFAMRAWQQAKGQLPAWSAALHAALVAQPYAPGQPLKTPWQWLVEVAHALAAGRQVQDAALLVRWTRLLGQPLFERSTPDGYPWLAQDWTNPGQFTQRWQVARELVSGQSRLFGPSMTLQDLWATPLLRHWLEHVSPQTAAALDAAANPADRLTLLLLAPETMTQAWVFSKSRRKG